MITINLLPIHIVFLHEFTVKNVMMVTTHSERLPFEIVSQLLAQCICPSRVMRKINFITDELDFP